MSKYTPKSNPAYLDENIIKQVIEAVPRVFIMKHVSQLCDIPYKTFYHWMKRGKRELDANEDTIYTKLNLAYNRALSDALVALLSELRECPKNYGAIVWILEHCYKKEFMTLPDDVQKILDWVNKDVLPVLEKGGSINGEQIKEMDPESN